jgi:hypothetical protein
MIRKCCLAGVCGLACALLFFNQAPTPAKDKKEDLKKEVAHLKKTLADRDQQITTLQGQLQKAKDDLAVAKKKSPAKLQKDLDAANQSLKDKDDTIAALQKSDQSKEVVRLRKDLRPLEALKKAPFVHTTILKMKKMDDEQVKMVTEEAGKTLAKIDGVRGFWIGKPAENGTPELAQKGYQLGIVVVLDDADALQKFLDDPLHKQFADKMTSQWERPVVYDFQRDMDDPKKDDKTDAK